jgi:tetratricopeptide (TPR) repeat protein
MALMVRLRRFGCIAAAIVLVACNPYEAVEPKPELIRRGDDLAARQQYREAIEAYRLAVNSDPKDGSARLKLANAYAAVSDWTQAASEAVSAADLVPDNVEAQLLAARLILTQNRFIDAADRMSAVLKDQPANARAQIIWGNATSHLPNSTWALDHLSAAIGDKTRFYDARREIRPLTARTDDLAAEAAFRTAERLAPTMIEAQLALVNFLWAVGRPDEGEERLKRVADRNPAEALANRALGEFYVSRHRDAEGEHYLRNAATIGRDRQARFALADYYSRTDRDDDARTILQSMPIADDASGELSLRLAGIEVRAGKPREAVRQLDALMAREPENLRALLLKARVLCSMGNPDPRYARAAVDRNPNSSEARAALGDVLLVNRNLDQAFDEYSEALRLDPESIDLPLKLARLALVIEQHQAAERYAREAVRKNPDSRDAAVVLVKALVAIRNYDDADRALQPLLIRFPTAPDVLAQAGAMSVARGNDAAARAAFDRALLSDNESFDALSGLVLLDAKQRRVADARSRMEAALARHPDDSAYLLLAARVYTAADDMPHAESLLRQVLDIDHANERAVLTLSDFLAHRGRRDEAKRELDHLLERHPESVAARVSLGILLEQMGRPADAREQYEKIVGQSSRAPVAAARLAALYVDQGENLDVALALATAANQQRPNDPAVSDVLGWVYMKRNLPGLALAYLQEAVRADPDNPRYRFHLATAYHRSGNLKGARDEFSKALQLDPNFTESQQARSALASLPK